MRDDAFAVAVSTSRQEGESYTVAECWRVSDGRDVTFIVRRHWRVARANQMCACCENLFSIDRDQAD